MKKNIILLAVVILLLSSCRPTGRIDLDEIQKRGKLVVITGYSPISYFIYHGQPMGYEYELVSLLAEHLGVKKEFIIARDIDEMISMLRRGDGDIIAYNLTITSDRRKLVEFTRPLNVTRQVLIQRKPQNWRSMMLHEIERELIRDPFDLAGKTIYVRKGSAYMPRLKNLSEEIGGEIQVIEAPSELTTEDLIRLVYEGEIDFTVADENIARINQAFFTDLDVDTPVSLPQQTAWAVRKRSLKLLQAVDEWIDEIQAKAEFYVIYNKYFENRRAFRTRVASEYFTITGDRISPYDEIIKKYADTLGWDWRLLAAQVYQESQFQPRARSWAGAVGLMQLLPRTAREFGAENLYDPYENIQAGINFLLWLDEYWEPDIPNRSERTKFILASYNVGQGHVQDARRLTEKYGYDSNVWENVGEFLIKKSDPEYYNDEVVQFGYANGIEPVTYVDNILYYFDHYRRFVE